MDKQLIINVGRQVGSGGLIIAKMLAKAFDCKFYDKEILNLAAQESGFSEKFFEKNDETKEYLRSRFHIHVPLLGESSSTVATSRKRDCTSFRARLSERPHKRVAASSWDARQTTFSAT